jgi:hypothetical protein
MPDVLAARYVDIARDNSSCKIIPFPKRTGIDHIYNTTSSGLINSKDTITKEAIEAIVYEILIKEKLIRQERYINPFGSVYLCDLKPDSIDYAAVERIKLFSEIKDLSDTISFNDGMDE